MPKTALAKNNKKLFKQCVHSLDKSPFRINSSKPFLKSKEPDYYPKHRPDYFEFADHLGSYQNQSTFLYIIPEKRLFNPKEDNLLKLYQKYIGNLAQFDLPNGIRAFQIRPIFRRIECATQSDSITIRAYDYTRYLPYDDNAEPSWHAPLRQKTLINFCEDGTIQAIHFAHFSSKRGKPVPLDIKISDSLDLANNLVFQNAKLFRIVRDIQKREYQINNNLSYVQHLTYKLPFTYTEVLTHNNLSREDIIKKHYKDWHKLDKTINFKKFTAWQLIALKQLKTKITAKEFARVINFVRSVRYIDAFKLDNYYGYAEMIDKMQNNWFFLYAQYLCKHFKIDPKDEMNYDKLMIISDFINNWRIIHPNRSMQVDLTSFNAFTKLENDLANDAESAGYLKEFHVKRSTIITKHKQWTKLRENIKDIKSLKIIETAGGLITEGEKMHHCVGSYIGKVYHGDSIILHYIAPDNTPYTLEVVTVPNSTYAINQLYSKYDAYPPKGLNEKLTKLINKK